MKRNTIFNSLVGIALVALLVAAAAFTALSLGAKQPSRIAIPNVRAPQAPAGCVPVAPGAYTAVCPTARGVAAPADLRFDCAAVAPGAYTSICTRR